MHVKAPQFAGTLYPSDPDQLSAQLAEILLTSKGEHTLARFIVVPNVGYLCASHACAMAYRTLQFNCDVINQVVLIGHDSNLSPENQLVFPAYQAFKSPLGQIAVNNVLIEELIDRYAAYQSNTAFEQSPAIEMQLPFLQLCLLQFQLIPMLVNDANQANFAGVLNEFIGSPETLIVVSQNVLNRDTISPLSPAATLLDIAKIRGYQAIFHQLPAFSSFNDEIEDDAAFCSIVFS